MFRTPLLVALISMGVVATAASDAWAQRTGRSISRPSLSPYSNMFRAEAGMMDPYLTLIRPYLQQSSPERTVHRQAAPGPTMSNPGMSAESLRARQRAALQQQAGGIAPTGTGSVYMNMGHYYQSRNYRR